MSFRLLGTAAGGGLPQWNCTCPTCQLSRHHPAQCPPRLHLQAAFGSTSGGWFLINASPDLLLQIRSTSELQPSSERGPRNTPIRGIILTSAELDQVLGLLLLREFQPLTLYTTRTVREVLQKNSFFRMLERVPDHSTWIDIEAGQAFSCGETLCTPIAMPGSLPRYAKSEPVVAGEATLGLLLEHEGKRVAYTPSVPKITPELKNLYASCDVIFTDGTFWSDTELQDTHPGTPLARSIGHVPMSGAEGTIESLADMSGPRKIFIHINNTNPVLNRNSVQHQSVLNAGWELVEDGWQLA